MKLFGVFILILPLTLAACRLEERKLSSLQAAPVVYEVNKISYHLQNYCVKPDVTLREIILLNTNAKHTRDGYIRDFDGDGVPDFIEKDPKNESLGIDLRLMDTNGDHYGDLVVYATGMSFKSQERLLNRECNDKTKDSDQDGLTDCEELNVLQTNPFLQDTDGDGLSDYLEVRVGLSPLDGRDAFLDPDGDGLINSVEVKMNTPIFETNTAVHQAAAYKYSVTPAKSENDQCSSVLNFAVSNIPVMNVPHGNRIMVMLSTQSKGNAGNGFQTCCGLVSRLAEDGAKVIVDGSNTEPVRPKEIEAGVQQVFRGKSGNLYCPCPSNDALMQLEGDIASGK